MKTKTKSTSDKWAGLSILSAVAASLCCITPVLALIAGTSGIASSFSWLEPLRPYLIGLTVAVLAFAWYQKLKPRNPEEIECDCAEDDLTARAGKKPFLQTKLFLGLVTVFAAFMLAFPYYSSVFYPDPNKEAAIANSLDTQTVQLDIAGMSCETCNLHVAHAALEVEGVIEAKADYKTGKAEVKYDQTKTSTDAIVKSIDATGYKVIDEEKAK